MFRAERVRPVTRGRGQAVSEPFSQETRTGLRGGLGTGARRPWDPVGPGELSAPRMCLNSGCRGVHIRGTELGSGDPVSVRRPREGNRETGARGPGPGRPLWPPQRWEGPRAGSTFLQEPEAVPAPQVRTRYLRGAAGP